jgi:hypothetical protein
MEGPSIKGRGVKGEAAAIAAWNSISMAPIPPLPVGK